MYGLSGRWKSIHLERLEAMREKVDGGYILGPFLYNCESYAFE